jgi:hypothetical protein
VLTVIGLGAGAEPAFADSEPDFPEGEPEYPTVPRPDPGPAEGDPDYPSLAFPDAVRAILLGEPELPTVTFLFRGVLSVIQATGR